MVEEVQYVNIQLNVPYISKTDIYTYFKVIPSAAITSEETSLQRIRVIVRNLTVKG
jgi:hypothetical protein